MEKPRLVERAFPLKQASLDSVHEKNVRHGHISTLHIWPARRPLAACRAALIATLLPDPGDAGERRQAYREDRRAGRSEDREEEGRRASRSRSSAKRRTAAFSIGGARRAPTCDWFREEIRRRTAAVLPGCLTRSPAAVRSRLKRCGLDAKSQPSTSIPSPGSSSNARWNIRRSWPVRSGRCPSSCSSDCEFMEAFFKAQGLKGATLRTQLERLPLPRPVASFRRGGS